jgi:hypothetical protein
VSKNYQYKIVYAHTFPKNVTICEASTEIQCNKCHRTIVANELFRRTAKDRNIRKRDGANPICRDCLPVTICKTPDGKTPVHKDSEQEYVFSTERELLEYNIRNITV